LIEEYLAAETVIKVVVMLASGNGCRRRDTRYGAALRAVARNVVSPF
jgi:hypothetical protein